MLYLNVTNLFVNGGVKMPTNKKILIIGGSGFLGQELCLAALKKDYTVASLSKHGKPAHLSKELSDAPIDWITCDLFATDQLEKIISQFDIVIHLVAILKEQPKKGLTYQKMILDAAMIVGNASKNTAIERFVFLSANAGSPFIPKKYLENKQLAENYLKRLPFPLTVVRPGLLYGKGRPSSLTLANLLFFFLKIPLLKRFFIPLKPTPVTVCATNIVASLDDVPKKAYRILTLEDLQTKT